MISRKDPNSTEWEPLRASKSPTKMVTANGEVQTKGKTTVDVRELDLFVTGMLLEDTPAVNSESSAKITGIITIGPVVKNHISSKWQKDRLQHGELRTNRCSCFIDELFKLIFTYISHTFIAGSRNSTAVSTRSESTSEDVRGKKSSRGPTETEKHEQKWRRRGSTRKLAPWSARMWLKEFRCFTEQK